jgi:N-acetyl-alpha-D-muramate 1-phosphate uridylyltransferase
MLPVVILAGGLATRLRPVTEKIPKSLVKINNEPFVYHQLRLLKNKGIERVHFCLGYLGEMVEEFVVKNFKSEFELSFSYDGETLRGTGGAVLNAFSLLPETFFVTYGDSYLDIDYLKINDCYFENRHDYDALMTVYHNNGKWDSSNVIFMNKQIELYSKKVKDQRMEYIDYGLGILSKTNFADYKKKQMFDLAEIYEKISRNGKLLGYEVLTRFYEIGSFKGIEDISTYLKTKQ